MTDKLLGEGYIAGYNVPYSKEIFKADNYETGYEGYTYTTDPRAELFKSF